MTTSWGSRLPAVVAEPGPVARANPAGGGAWTPRSASSRSRAASSTVHVLRLARARPPRAGPPPCRSAPPARRAAARPPAASACASSSARMRATVVVLPSRARRRRRRAGAARRRRRRGAGGRGPRRRRTAGQPGREGGARPRRPPAWRPREQVGGHGALVLPVAVEVEVRARRDAAGGPRRTTSLAAEGARASSRRVGPGQRVEIDGRVGVAARGGRDRRQVDADVARAGAPRTANAAASATASSSTAPEAGQAQRDVDVGGREHAGLVERVRAGRRRRAPAAASKGRCRRPTVTRRPSVEQVAQRLDQRRPAVASDRRRTGCPSTVTCSTALMPRRKR